MKPEVREPLRLSLMQHEGLVLKAYDDKTGQVVHPGTTVGGWVTVGYGRNLVGRGITVGEAEYLLANDIAAVERELNTLLPHWATWTPARQWAIAELTFNMGVGRFLAGWPNTAADLRAGRFVTVAATLSGSKWRRDVGDGRALPIIRAMHRGTWT
jgi:lysozyme